MTNANQILMLLWAAAQVMMELRLFKTKVNLTWTCLTLAQWQIHESSLRGLCYAVHINMSATFLLLFFYYHGAPKQRGCFSSQVLPPAPDRWHFMILVCIMNEMCPIYF